MTDLFDRYNIDVMNETDVREVIVRPLLHALGYRQGTEANILTEKTLRYSKIFLGRKKPDKDPDLIGRADYICEVVSFGRWVVEVKSPKAELTIDDAHQAHTYAAHPEVAAIFSLLTNGREFRLYKISEPEQPILSWKTEETERYFVNIANLLSPDAVKRRVFIPVDLGKPLAIGFNSTIEMIGGFLVYERHKATAPIFATVSNMAGMRASVTGKTVYRKPDGRIEGELELAGPYSVFDYINRSAGIGTYLFSTSDEYISVNREKPTIFQNVFTATIVPGTDFPALPGSPPGVTGYRLPFGMSMAAYTEAVGYIDKDRFIGTFEITYDIRFSNVPPQATLRVPIPQQADLYSEGTFDIRIR